MIRFLHGLLGALVLVCKEPATTFSMLSVYAFTELQAITGHIEGTLKKTFNYDKINYLMLMMVDPEVHYHVIPRYSEDKVFNGVIFKDSGWDGLPDLSISNTVPDDIFYELRDYASSILNEL